VPEGVADGVKHGAADRVAGGRESIVHPHALLPRLDQARAAQVRQVSRGPRLRDLQRLVDVADAHLAAEEQAEDPEPGPVGQRLEQGFEAFVRGYSAVVPCRFRGYFHIRLYSP
jgi:hypothetical protein